MLCAEVEAMLRAGVKAHVHSGWEFLECRASVVIDGRLDGLGVVRNPIAFRPIALDAAQ